MAAGFPVVEISAWQRLAHFFKACLQISRKARWPSSFGQALLNGG
jgi:hypothetical protein